MIAPRKALSDCHTVRAALLRHLGAADSQGIVVRGPVRSGRYSDIYCARLPGMNTELAVKCLIEPTTGEPDRATAQRQFEALERVHHAMPANGHFRVPRPYLAVPSDGIVVVEWISGRSMTDLFLSTGLTLVEARALMRRAAGWLRCFSDSGMIAAQPLNVADKLNALASMETLLGRSKTAQEAFATLRAYAERAGTLALTRSWLHGDFKTDNLLIDANHTVGIDLHARHENAVTHDLAAFLNHWELTLCHPRAWRWRPWRAELARVFLDTFDPSYLDAKRLPYRWTALHVMLGNWCEFTKRERRTLQHVYLRMCFRSVVKRMTGQLHVAAHADDQQSTRKTR